MPARKIVVTGAAGFIGSQLAKKLVELGHDVHMIDNLSHGHIENIMVDGRPIGEFHQRDIRDANISDILRGADCVFHLAAISALPQCQRDPQEAIAVNVGGVANVLEHARRQGVRRVVFASTSAVYENNTQFPCREDDAIAPTLIYSLSKQQAEGLCHAMAKTYGMDIVITRYYNVYGPQQDVVRKSPAFVGYVIRELLAGRAPILHSNGEQKRDYVYVDDINDINLLCMEKAAAQGNIYNIASGEAWSVNELYATIVRAVGIDIAPVFRAAARFWDAYPELSAGPFPLPEARLTREVEKFTLGTSEKARQELGWRAKTPIEEGLRMTARDMRRRLVGAD